MLSTSCQSCHQIFIAVDVLELLASGNVVEATERLTASLLLNEEEIRQLANNTVGQFANVLYCQLRNKRVTASRIYDVKNMIKRIKENNTGNYDIGHHEYLLNRTKYTMLV